MELSDGHFRQFATEDHPPTFGSSRSAQAMGPHVRQRLFGQLMGLECQKSAHELRPVVDDQDKFKAKFENDVSADHDDPNSHSVQHWHSEGQGSAGQGFSGRGHFDEFAKAQPICPKTSQRFTQFNQPQPFASTPAKNHTLKITLVNQKNSRRNESVAINIRSKQVKIDRNP